MRVFAAAALAGMGVILGGCDLEDFDGGERSSVDFHYSYPLKAGGTVSVETFNGGIEIVGWDQNTVDISGAKYARTEQLRDGIKIETANSNGSVSVRAVRPFENHTGNMGARFVLHVPKTVDLDRVVTSNGKIEVRDVAGKENLRTSNGRITAESVAGPFEASTSNGAISVRESDSAAHAPVHVKTSNGGIEIFAMRPLTGDLHASTSNGSITVRMPGSTEARVRATTSNSTISSDFDVDSQAGNTKHHLEGSINHAHGDAPMIDLSTSNGSIRLSKM